MKFMETLTAAEKIVLTDRAEEYGEATYVPTHIRIAQVWSGILDHEVQPQQVALMMAGLKLVRASGTPDHDDSYIDAIGYVGIAAEIVDMPEGV